MVTGALVLILAPSTQVSAQQENPRSVVEIARSYNEKIQKLQDQYDALRNQFVSAKPGSNEIGRIQEEMSAISRQMEGLWDDTMSAQKAAFRKTRDDIVRFNESNQKLTYSTAILDPLDGFFGNLRQFPTLGDFEKNKEQMSQEWDRKYAPRLKPFGEEFAQRKEELFREVKEAYKIDLKAVGYARIGTSNPYENNAYYRYYDPTGKLWMGVWTDAAKSLQKWQKDSEASSRRQRDQKSRLENERRDFLKLQRDFMDSRNSLRSNVRGMLAEVEQARRDSETRPPPRPSQTTKRPPRETPGGSVAGTEWRMNGGRGYIAFRAGGSAIVAASKGTAAKTIRWSQSGNQVTIELPDGSRSFTLSGDTMTDDSGNTWRKH
jgi:hypothetical protein